MKRIDFIKIILSIVATVFLTKVAYGKMVAYLSSFSIAPDFNGQTMVPITTETHFKILIFCFVYIFLLVSLPFFLSAFAQKLKITRKN